MHVPAHWIVVGALVLVGLGILPASKARARRILQPRTNLFSGPAKLKGDTNEIELDVWLTGRNRGQRSSFIAGWDIYWRRAAAPALRSARAGARSGLRLG